MLELRKKWLGDGWCKCKAGFERKTRGMMLVVSSVMGDDTDVTCNSFVLVCVRKQRGEYNETLWGPLGIMQWNYHGHHSIRGRKCVTARRGRVIHIMGTKYDIVHMFMSRPLINRERYNSKR